MAAERDLELLDDYLANRLNPSEKSEFEQKLNSDNSLKQELELQQRMISGIKSARVMELKSMLNNVPVPPVQTPAAVATKVALYTVMTVLTATGVYFYLNQPQQVDASKEQTSAPAQKEDSSSSETAIITKEKNDSQRESEPSASTDQPQSQSGKPATAKADDQEISKQPVLDVYNPQEENVSNDLSSDKQNTTSEEHHKSSLVVDVDKQNKKYNFHYQLKDGKVLLFGPFESNLYEIMEFFSDDKRTVFLYYKDNYYLLRDDNENINSLTPLKDQALIAKLKEYRGN